MAIVELYSKRQKLLRGEQPEVFVYDSLSNKIRIQIVQILKGTIGEYIPYSGANYPINIYDSIHNTLCKEYGVHSLNHYGKNGNYEISIFQFIQEEDNVENVLDAVELAFKCIDICVRDIPNYNHSCKINLTPQEAIDELNIRFKESGIGYQFASEIIRMDSTYMHSEVTLPTLTLLSIPVFKGALDEYMSAHNHYKEGRNVECLNDCLKAFESTMKIICTEKGWEYNQNDTSNKLIKVCLDNHLIPTYLQTEYTSFNALLSSGISAIRNRNGAHGQGVEERNVTDELVRYAMNLTGTNIIFLIELSGIK